jgi:hypothetical protein
MRLALAAVVFFSTLQPLFAADLGTAISLKDFTAIAEGEYTIRKADGHDTNYPDGSVLDEGEEVVMTFPYCPPGGTLCDPGYIFLPKEPKTAVLVYKKEIPNAGALYTIVHKEGVDEFVYEWEVPLKSGDDIRFRRFGYVYGNNAPMTLEFLFTKNAPKP